MTKVSLRFLLKISLTLLLNPTTSAKSFCFIPICSIRNLMASIGSGIPIGKFSFSYRSIKIDRISSSSPCSVPFLASKISSSRFKGVLIVFFVSDRCYFHLKFRLRLFCHIPHGFQQSGSSRFGYSKLNFTIRRYLLPFILNTIRFSFNILALGYSFFSSFRFLNSDFSVSLYQAVNCCSLSACFVQKSLKVLLRLLSNHVLSNKDTKKVTITVTY